MSERENAELGLGASGEGSRSRCRALCLEGGGGSARAAGAERSASPGARQRAAAPRSAASSCMAKLPPTTRRPHTYILSHGNCKANITSPLAGDLAGLAKVTVTHRIERHTLRPARAVSAEARGVLARNCPHLGLCSS